jgi:hypothetical protein
MPTASAISVLAFAIAVKWELRERLWFWITVIVFAALHIPPIFLVPWTTKWVPALAFAAIASWDLIGFFAIIALVARLTTPETLP